MTKPKHKLATIVFTDIVGFTELSAKNEPAALELLNKQRKILKPIVEEHGGDWLKEIGDGLLLTFNTNIEAVLCSIAIQDVAKPIPELDLRIGIHQGEVVFQGNDIVGDDVNIASRIEPFSSLGGIAISDRVNASLERDPEFETTFIGKPALKGVSQEIKVYCVTSHGLPQTDLTKVKAKLEPVRRSFLKKYVFPITGTLIVLIGGVFWFLLPLLTIGSAIDIHNYEKRIAVLYLENRGNEEDSYFSEGLTEEIITRLSRVNKISVVSRFNVVEYKGKNINLDDIRDNLEADYLLTGNVMKLNEKIKISVELVDLEKQDVEWSTSFEKDMSDIFSIQDEVAFNIVENLNIKIGSRDRELVLADPTTNIDAYDTLLRMKKDSYNETIALKNIEEINEILTHDPKYADALAFRAALHIYYFMNAGLRLQPYTAENKKYVEQAISDAEDALKYDPLNLIALSTLPNAYIWSAIKTLDTSSKILAARKSLVSINNLKNSYPDHYMTSLIIGVYHTMKDTHPLTMSSRDYEMATKFLTEAIISAEKGINNDISDPFLLFAYQGALELMIITEHKYSSFSDAIYFADIAIDFLKNEYNIIELISVYYWSCQPKFMVGDYDGVIKDIADQQKLAEQLPQTFDIVYSTFNSSLILGYVYVQLGKMELGLEIINQLDTNKILFDNYWKAKPEYYGYLALSYYESGNEEKAIYYFNKNDQLIKTIYENDKSKITNSSDIHNRVKSWEMLGQACTANLLVEKNEIANAKSIIKDLERNLSNISVLVSSMAIDIPYYLALAHKGLNNYSEYKRYMNIAYNEIIKISSHLNDEHKETYLNKVQKNRDIIALKNDI